MEFQYVRVQGRESSYIAQYPKGVFSLCWNLIRDGVMSPEDERAFREIDDWFKANLPEPEPCVNHEKVITFFKCGASEMWQQAERMLRLLDRYQKPYDVVYTNSVGTVVYEDEWQVAVKVENGELCG